MSDLNHVTGTARVASEPKIYQTEKSAVARMFAIINGDDATPVNIVAFGKDTVEFVKANVHKGTKISFEGELAKNEYEKDGVKRSSLQIALRPGRSKLDAITNLREMAGERQVEGEGVKPAA